jgi:hypothetical protein
MLPGAVEITNGGVQGGSGEVATVGHSGFEQDRDEWRAWFRRGSSLPRVSAKSAASIYSQAGATEAELVIVTPTLHEREGGG